MSLAYRAEMLAKTRQFFADRGVLEVDTNVLSETAPVDAHIDVMKVEMGHGKVGYLHTSPEYGMKKLLCNGSSDIYQLGHVFRAGEEGPLHCPEFTMLEWYRIGMDFEEFIKETLDLIRLFLGPLPSETLSYKKALETYASGDLTEQALEFTKDARNWDPDAKRDLVFTHKVEPHLGKNCITVITDYPATQAALAKKAVVEGELVAKRFEAYFQGIELCNGYDELTDAKEQRARFHEENTLRKKMGKEELPIDEEFLTALGKGLPECCGVAVGFDRLVNLQPNSVR